MIKNKLLSSIQKNTIFSECYEIQKNTIKIFFKLSKKITKGSLKFRNNIPEYENINKNFFSVLFLTVIKSLLKDDKYLPLYAFINQCMRASVTACDNILDDEYKEIFPFDIKEDGKKIKSVFTLMISDRVLSDFIIKYYKDENLLHKVNSLTFKALVIPALQECEEEIKPLPRLTSEEIINKVHKRKTGDLFASTLALPFMLENIPIHKKKIATNAVTSFGMACQIIDDIKDMQDDIKKEGYNYIFSLESEKKKNNEKHIKKIVLSNVKNWDACENFLDSCKKAQIKSLQFFNNSFNEMNKLNICFTNNQQKSIIELMYELLKVKFILPNVDREDLQLH